MIKYSVSSRDMHKFPLSEYLILYKTVRMEIDEQVSLSNHITFLETLLAFHL